MGRRWGEVVRGRCVLVHVAAPFAKLGCVFKVAVVVNVKLRRKDGLMGAAKVGLLRSSVLCGGVFL